MHWEAKVAKSRQASRQRANIFKSQGLVASATHGVEDRRLINPFLVHLHPDPQLSRSLMYPLLQGRTSMGGKSATEEGEASDIQLGGWSAAPETMAYFDHYQGVGGGRQGGGGAVRVLPGRQKAREGRKGLPASGAPLIDFLLWPTPPRRPLARPSWCVMASTAGHQHAPIALLRPHTAGH